MHGAKIIKKSDSFVACVWILGIIRNFAVESSRGIRRRVDNPFELKLDSSPFKSRGLGGFFCFWK